VVGVQPDGAGDVPTVGGGSVVVVRSVAESLGVGRVGGVEDAVNVDVHDG
jgi:hypothetical protein